MHLVSFAYCFCCLHPIVKTLGGIIFIPPQQVYELIHPFIDTRRHVPNVFN